MQGRHPVRGQGIITGPEKEPFLLAVITLPVFFTGEAAILEGLLAAGLEKLHLRKPGAGEEEMEGLLKQIAPRWRPGLVLHGGRKLWRLADRYGIPQVHCPVNELGVGTEGLKVRTENLQDTVQGGAIGVLDGGLLRRRGSDSRPLLSASLHSWGEMKEVQDTELTYVFMSPVFNSISKRGYMANPLLLRRPAGPYPCKVIGLGGIDKDTIGELIRGGWDGAAVLGWIWEEPGEIMKRYEQLKNSISLNCL